MTEKRSVLENPTGNDLGPVKKISHMRLPNLTKQRSSTKTTEACKSGVIDFSSKKLGARERRAFRKIFDGLDLENSGTLTAEELHVCVNKLAGYDALTFSEVMKILNEIDVKGTGDIEFDEFIYFMTRPQNLNKMITDEDRKLIEKETGIKPLKEEEHEDSKVDDVLFHILRKVLEQDENRDIRTFYRGEFINKMNDHVINDWSDGKRCIGLSNETMMKRYKNILRRKYRTDSRCDQQESPYSKPNMWGVNELKNDIAKQRRLREQLKTENQNCQQIKPERVQVREMQVTVKAVPLPCYHVLHRPSRITYDDLKQIRFNVSKLQKNYYGYLRDTSNVNAKTFYDAVGIHNIKNTHNKKMTDLAFQSYAKPFVISPWVPGTTGWKVRAAWK